MKKNIKSLMCVSLIMSFLLPSSSSLLFNPKQCILPASIIAQTFSQQEMRTKLKYITTNIGYQWDDDLLDIHKRANHLLQEKKVDSIVFTAIVDDYEQYLVGGVRQQENTKRLGLEKGQAISYFSMEYGLAYFLNIYSGGLGVLSGGHVRGASDRYSHGSFVGVGAFYREGYYRQIISGNGEQKELYPAVDMTKYGEIVKDAYGNDILLSVKIPRGDIYITIKAKALKVRAGRVDLFLLTTNIKENEIYIASENRVDMSYRFLLDRLYVGGNPLTRLMQEYVLGTCGRQLLEKLNIAPPVLHLNEGHSAFSILEAVRSELLSRVRNYSPILIKQLECELEYLSGEVTLRDLLIRYNQKFPEQAQKMRLTFNTVAEDISKQVVFTGHTPVPAGNEYFPVTLVQTFLKPYAESIGIEVEELIQRGRVYSKKFNSIQFGLTEFILSFAGYANGVSRRHGEVASTMYVKTNQYPIEEQFVRKLVDFPGMFSDQGFYKEVCALAKILEMRDAVTVEEYQNYLQTEGPKNVLRTYYLENEESQHFGKDFHRLTLDEYQILINKYVRNLYSKITPSELSILLDAIDSKYEFDFITNAVHRTFWQDEEMQLLLGEYFTQWVKTQDNKDCSIDDLTVDQLKEILVLVPNEEILKTKKLMKQRATMHLKTIRKNVDLDPEAFTIVIARRFATYKRATMILDKAKYIIEDAKNRGVKVQIVFAGKAHPNDHQGKRMIQEIINRRSFEEYGNHIFFVENYEIDVAKDLIAIADVWHNNPEPPKEASGTSGQKAAHNGVVNVSTPDGWVLEALESVFFFTTVDELENTYSGDYRVYQRPIPGKFANQQGDVVLWECMDADFDDPCRTIFAQVNGDLAPTQCPKCKRPAIRPSVQYERGIIDMWKNHPDQWAKRMKLSIAEGVGLFNMPRFIEEYEEKAYIPAIVRTQTMVLQNMEEMLPFLSEDAGDLEILYQKVEQRLKGTSMMQGMQISA